MIDVVAFDMSHIEDFDSKFEYEDLERDMNKNILDINKMIMSLIWRDKVLAIVGVTTFRKGVGELWLLPSVHVDSCAFGFFKTVKRLIHEFAFPHLEFHRLEIAIMDGWDKGMKWAKALGFKESHVCEAYDSQYRDHVIFTRIV